MPEGSSQYTYLQSKRWRALGYNWDVLSTYGNTSRLYCLTDFQAAWLLSNTEYMRWSSRWQNCPCTQEDLDALKAEMEYNLMNCLDVQPWQLDYIYDQMQAQNLEALDALWDGVNANSVNPNTPNDFYSGDDSDDRLNALCTACKIYVYSYAENWLAKASVGLGIAVLVGLAASITIVGGVIASVLVGGLAYVTSIAMDAMQDEVALDKVICCMNNNLDGSAITTANFETALDGCSFTVGSNEAIIRDIIAADLDQFGNWLSFINQLGNSYVLAQVGVIDCPCVDEFEYVLDLVAPLNSCLNIVRGTQAVDGVDSQYSTNPLPGGSNSQDNLLVTLDIQDTTVLTNAIIVYDRPTASSVTGLSGRIGNNTLDVVYVDQYDYPLGVDLELDAGPGTYSNFGFFLRGGTTGSAHVTAKQIILRGLKSENGGVDPFAGGIC